MAKLILGIVLAVLCIVGYMLYGRHQIKMEISRTQDKIEQLNRDLNENQTRITEETEKQNKIQNQLAEFPKKKQQLLSAKNELNNELKNLPPDQSPQPRINAKAAAKSLVGGNADNTADNSPGEMQKEIAKLNSAIDADQEEVKKLDCHYNCMGNEKLKDKSSSDNGTWDRFSRPPVWTCKKHQYSFTDNIQYMDYRYESAKCANRIKENQNKIATLTGDIEKARLDQQEKAKTLARVNEINAKLSQLESQQKNLESEAIRLNQSILDADKTIMDCQKMMTDINNEIKTLSNKIYALKNGK